MCRASLSGGYLDTTALVSIGKNRMKDILLAEIKNGLYQTYYNNDANGHGDARLYVETFSPFIDSNTTISEANATRIFKAFIAFAHEEYDNELNPDANTVRTSYDEFQIIGEQMLKNRNLTYEQAREAFFIQH